MKWRLGHRHLELSDIRNMFPNVARVEANLSSMSVLQAHNAQDIALIQEWIKRHQVEHEMGVKS